MAAIYGMSAQAELRGAGGPGMSLYVQSSIYLQSAISH